MKKTVLITGASGKIGSILRKALAPTYTIRALSRRPLEDVETIVGDISDFQAVLTACQGVDSIIHLAANASPWAPWDEVLNANIIGTYHVYEAAVKAGVKQVIFASSNHAVGNYDHEYAPDIYRTGQPYLDHLVPIRPDGLYGVSKCFGEALGRYYTESLGLHVICLRIGYTNQQDAPPLNIKEPDKYPESPERLAALYLSHRDIIQLINKSLQAEHIIFDIFYGISNNQPHYYDLAHVREGLGYVPEDGASVRASIATQEASPEK